MFKFFISYHRIHLFAIVGKVILRNILELFPNLLYLFPVMFQVTIMRLRDIFKEKFVLFNRKLLKNLLMFSDFRSHPSPFNFENKFHHIHRQICNFLHLLASSQNKNLCTFFLFDFFFQSFHFLQISFLALSRRRYLCEKFIPCFFFVFRWLNFDQIRFLN